MEYKILKKIIGCAYNPVDLVIRAKNIHSQFREKPKRKEQEQ